jgi:hypothetical protein
VKKVDAIEVPAVAEDDSAAVAVGPVAVAVGPAVAAVAGPAAAVAVVVEDVVVAGARVGAVTARSSAVTVRELLSVDGPARGRRVARRVSAPLAPSTTPARRNLSLSVVTPVVSALTRRVMVPTVRGLHA